MAESGVVEATYVFDTSTIYDAAPIDFEVASIQFRLADYTIRARRSALWPSIASARRDIAPVFRSWRLQQQLTNGFADFDFRFLSAEVVGDVEDASAYPSEPVSGIKDDQGPLVVTCLRYPDPPQILATPELEAAADRFQRARMEFGESLESAAYFALTVAVHQAGGRKEACSRFGVETDVLRRIGLLTSTRGTLKTARKAGDGVPVPLSRSESRWLQLAVRTLLLHIGIVNAGGTPPRVGMQDLPQ